MKQLNVSRRILLNLAGALAVGLLLLASAGLTPAAYAAGPTSAGSYPRLEYGLKLLGLRLKDQQSHLDLARETAGIARSFIDEQAAKGKDTSALEAALVKFNTGIEQAQAIHAEAAQILEEKAGYDADGKVTDPEQARETLQNAADKIRQAGETLRQAFKDFRQAMREFRRAEK